MDEKITFILKARLYRSNSACAWYNLNFLIQSLLKVAQGHLGMEMSFYVTTQTMSALNVDRW